MSGQLQTQMRHRDKEMVPRALVVGMFSLMLASVAIVTFAQLADVPNTGVLREASVVRQVDIVLVGDRSGHYEALTTDGREIADSAGTRDGFIGVMGRVIDRQRMLHKVEGNPPVSVVRRENGHVAIIDPATGMVVELIGYGADNVAAFADIVDAEGA